MARAATAATATTATTTATASTATATATTTTASKNTILFDGPTVKECIQQVHLQYDDPICDIPYIQSNYCYGDSCSRLIVDNGVVAHIPTSYADTCMFIAQSLLSEYGIFDVVLLPASICQDEIYKGEFTVNDIHRILPNTCGENLVSVKLSGQRVISTIEHGINHNNTINAYPKLAGIRFNIDENNDDKNKQISDVTTLSRSCEWETIQPLQQYKLLTIESIVNGLYGYDVLDVQWRSNIKVSPYASYIHRTLPEAVWRYMRHVCTVRDPFRTTIQSYKPIQPKLIRITSTTGQDSNTNTIVFDDKTPSQTVTTTINNTHTAIM